MANRTQKNNNSISYVVDARGKNTAMVIDLKNKDTRKWAEKFREDFMDWQIVEEHRKNAHTEYVDFFEYTDKLLAEK